MAHPHLLLLPSMKDPGEEARASGQNESSDTAHPAHQFGDNQMGALWAAVTPTLVSDSSSGVASGPLSSDLSTQVAELDGKK